MNMKIEGIFDPIERFEDFIKSYRTEDGTYKYRVMLQKMSLTGSKSLVIDFEDLLRFDPELAKKTLENPEEFIESASRAIKNVMLIEDPDYAKKIEKFYPRFKNLPEKISLRKIRSHHIGQLVAIDGIITRASEVKPQLIEAVFECQRCHEKIVVLQEEGKYTPPVQCTNPTCRRKGPFKLIVEESKFIDWQKIRVQERPEDLPPGQLPRFIDAYLKDDLVDIARPGDRVTVIGILKTSPEFGQRGRKTATFRVFIETNYVELTEKEAERLEITPEEEQKILELAKDQWIHKKIIRSIAPSIYGYDDIKEAIALLLFGGVPKTLPDGMRIRGEPNILLVGDPGTAKSQLLRYVARIAPRGIYTSGKGSTAAGLCVAPGTLVALDRGLLPIETLFEEKAKDGLTHIKNSIFVAKSAHPVKIQTINPLNISTRPSDEFWKLKSPERLIKITTRTGRQIILTPETKMISIENGKIIWKEAKNFRSGDNVAVARKLEHRGRKILTLELIEDQDNIVVYGAKTFVKKILEELKSKYNLTTRELARKLGINEDKLYYNWVNPNAKGNISLRELIKLAKMAGYTYDEISNHIAFFSQRRGSKIKLPKYINQDFMYFVGLVAGDGSISKTNYGGYSIRFSNTSTELRNKFKKLVEVLFGTSVEEGIDKNGTPYLRFHSKIVAYILKKLGIPESPKAHRIDMSEVMLSLPNNKLAAFISGLFDCDASVVEREGGSSIIEFDTTSEKLAKKIQLVLLRFGIISFLRKRSSTGKVEEFTDRNGRRKVIRTIHDKYVLTIYGENMKKFRDLIGFKYGAKKKKLEKVLSKRTKVGTNVDVIPKIGQILEIVSKFYDLKLKKKYNGSSISRRKLQEIVAYLRNAEAKKVKIALPYEIKEKITAALSSYTSKDLKKGLGISKSQFYEYFVRKNRNIKVPLDVLEKLITLLNRKNKKLVHELNLKINQIRIQMELVRKVIEYLDKLANSDIFWDKIKSIEILDSKDIPYVYDLTVKETHNFIANGIIVHNTAAVIRDPETGGMSLEAGALVLSDRGVACIDEFDKMNPQDRVAIHEAMEQQSYHPFFEITLADGTKVKIGDFVDDLFEQFPDRKIDGINCEILPVSDLNIEILTTDFDKIFKTKINRVSRHKAPSRFIKILYSNGREVLVTPEHPIFVFENGEIKTISADKVKTGVFVPAVEEIEFKGSYRLDTDIANGRKKVILPETMQGPIARFLGYYVAEGYSYNGTAAEVGLSNTNQDIISSMKSVVEEVFGISPIDYVNVNRTLRIVSKSLYNYMSKNFPELMKRSTDKRIPQKIFVAGTRERIEFLKTAFEGDGSIESEAIAYSTSSKGLAEDYQDLLLTLGIHSRICKDTYDASKGTLKRCRYKVYITGDSLKKFVDNIIPELKSHEKLKKLVERSEKTNRKHDVLPPYVGTMIIKCLKKLGMPYNGYFNEHINRNYGITREVVNRYLDIIESKIKEIEKIIRDINDLRKLRQTIGYSQAKVAKLINVTRSTVDYMERGGYDPEKRNNLLCKFKTTVLREIEEAKEIVNKIKRLKKFRWLRVKSVEVVSNRGELGTEWVYDITVEPTRNFISHGLVLHNTISIAKAGIVATLNARTAILAAANPKLGRYDHYRPPADNINLPPTILSRFDLIFILTDRPRVEVDKQVAEHILALHQMRTVEPPIPPDLLRKYIAYAKKNVHPVLTPEAAKRIEQFYLELRSIGEAPTSPVPITARQLEALIRLAEAHARMALRDRVTVEDAEEAIRLMKLSLQQVGIDSETGQLDIDLIMTGHSKSQRDKMEKILDLIDELSEDVDKAVPVSKLIERANIEGIDEEFVKRAIERMKKEGIIFEPRPGHVKKA